MTPVEHREIYEEQRKKWLIKHTTLERNDFPLSHFRNEEEAKKYAEEHGGYLSGIITIREEKYWCI